MNIYKITNITNLKDKRDVKKNSTLDVEYIDNMVKKTIKIKPKETKFLKLHTLSLSIRKLKINNLITISEVTEKELFDALIEVEKKEINKKKENKLATNKTTTNKTTTSKKSTKKSSEKKKLDFNEDIVDKYKNIDDEIN